MSASRRLTAWLLTGGAVLLLLCASYYLPPGDSSTSDFRTWATATGPGPTDLPSQPELEGLALAASSSDPTAVANAFVTSLGQTVSSGVLEDLARRPVEFVYSSLAAFGARAATIDGTAGGKQWRFVLSRPVHRWQIATMVPLP